MWRILVQNPDNPHYYSEDGVIVQHSRLECIVDVYYNSLNECLDYPIKVVKYED